MDASSQNWGNFFAHLHLAVNNATGVPVGAYFANQETLAWYYNVFKQILDKYGISAGFLTDKRTVFTYKRLDCKDESENTIIQFAFACKNLGVSLEATSVAQKKGQVERYNGIFKDRLRAKLIIHKIKTIEQANKYLTEIFIPEYLNEFRLSPNSCPTVFQSVYKDKINYYLSNVSRRKISKRNCICYKNKTYRTFDSSRNRIFLPPKFQCLVVKIFNDELFVNFEDKIYTLEEIKLNASYSATFYCDEQRPKEKKRYIPPMDHPWRHSNYEMFQQSFSKHYCY